MLPTLNLNAVSTDTGKQISSIKSYINQLKDSMDDELSHISYEQLDKNLQKKIDALNDSIKLAEENTMLVAETVKAKYITANEVAARYITASQVDAKIVSAGFVTADVVAANYASITEFNAVKGTVDTINANYINANYVSSRYATIGSLNAATARITSLETGGLAVMGSGAYRFYINATGVTIGGATCRVYYSGSGGASPIWGIDDNGTIRKA